MVPLGIRIYGLGAIAIGGVGLVWGDFALQWQPVAAGFPGRTALAYIFSAALLLAGALVNVRGVAAAGSAALATLYAAVVIFMHGPQIFQHPGAFAVWDGAAEQLALFAGALAAYSYLSGADDTLRPLAQFGRIAEALMGVCLLMFGLAHFLYLDFTASMVPAWLPGGQKFWAALTGVGHLAAGVAFLTGVEARLAAIALTSMFASFGALVHLHSLWAEPHNHLSWVINAINLALTGAAWAFATLLESTPAANSSQRVLQKPES